MFKFGCWYITISINKSLSNIWDFFNQLISNVSLKVACKFIILYLHGGNQLKYVSFDASYCWFHLN